MKKMLVSKMLVLALLCYLTTAVLAERRIVVPTDFPTIGEAISNAQPGDEIFVMRGVYRENIHLIDQIRLIGEDKFETIIDGGRRDFTIRAADNALIQNFTITGGYAVGILCDNTAPIIRNNIIKNNSGTGIMAVLSLPQIENNIIYGNEWTGIYLHAARSLNTKIDHNVIVENGYHGIAATNESGILITNNIIYGNKEYGVYFDRSSLRTRMEHNNVFNNLVEVTGEYIVSATNMRQEPVFEDKRTFGISDLSPMKRAGENARDIGLYSVEASLKEGAEIEVDGGQDFFRQTE